MRDSSPKEAFTAQAIVYGSEGAKVGVGTSEGFGPYASRACQVQAQYEIATLVITGTRVAA